MDLILFSKKIVVLCSASSFENHNFCIITTEVSCNSPGQAYIFISNWFYSHAALLGAFVQIVLSYSSLNTYWKWTSSFLYRFHLLWLQITKAVVCLKFTPNTTPCINSSHNSGLRCHFLLEAFTDLLHLFVASRGISIQIDLFQLLSAWQRLGLHPDVWFILSPPRDES